MSEAAAPETAPGENAEAKPKKASKLVLPLVVALMTVAGGAVGVVVVAPKLMADRAAKTAGLAADSGAAEGHAAEPAGKGPMFKIDNLIVNPAGSQGTRFLMVSVAVETPDAAFEAHLRSREPQIRDVVIAMLERQTMESLGIPGIRDTLKAQLADTISALSGSKSKLRVFLPQFVIQ